MAQETIGVTDMFIILMVMDSMTVKILHVTWLEGSIELFGKILA